jgi:RimJ/RimL family protein N-acetyltransferase
MSLPIKTERLLLRRFKDADRKDVIEFVSHPSVARATPEIEATEEGVRRYIALQKSFQSFETNRCFDLAIERIADEKVIGLLTLIRRKNRQAELGYALGVKFRAQGYATEAGLGLIEYAFKELKLHRIYATTSSANVSSYRVMERLGMRREATLKEASLRDGVRYDTLIYAVLAQEFPEPAD